MPDLDILLTSNNLGYGNWELPCPRDHEITAIVEDRCSSGGQRADLTRDHIDALRGYAERMASLAVRTNSPRLVGLGAQALGLIAELSDYREDLLVFCLLWNASERLGVDLASLASANLNPVCSGGLSRLEAFGHRSPKDRSLAAMGYVEGQDDGGFRYVRTW